MNFLPTLLGESIKIILSCLWGAPVSQIQDDYLDEL